MKENAPNESFVSLRAFRGWWLQPAPSLRHHRCACYNALFHAHSY